MERELQMDDLAGTGFEVVSGLTSVIIALWLLDKLRQCMKISITMGRVVLSNSMNDYDIGLLYVHVKVCQEEYKCWLE